MQQLHLRRVNVEAKPELVRGAKPISSSSIQTETSYMSPESEDQHKNDSGGERSSASSKRNNEESKEPKMEEPSLTATTSYGSDGSEDSNTNDNEDQRPSSAASDSKNNNDLIEELYDPSYDDLPTPLALSAESKIQDDLEDNTVIDPDSPQESEPKLLL